MYTVRKYIYGQKNVCRLSLTRTIWKTNASQSCDRQTCIVLVVSMPRRYKATILNTVYTQIILAVKIKDRFALTLKRKYK